eukprot:TRINITY_DN61_c0_g1_i2.p1 TRINITY_DN61_c0_g1~~TRINITY_DN61_c0_g1_i2.p1  ORF type:complete len:180 (-),score=48.30 TRINITY_DN61_c0_g1_i2:105-644(-)
MLLSNPKKRSISDVYIENEHYDKTDIESALLLIMLSEKFKKEEEQYRVSKKKRLNEEIVSQSDSEEESENSQSSQSSNTGLKKKRHRTTPEQLRVLESTFLVEKTPDIHLRKKLASQLDMTPRRVQVWFQNKRAKVKREMKKRENDAPSSFSPITDLYNMGYASAYQPVNYFPTLSYTQ